MKTIHNVTGIDILLAYSKLTSETFTTKKDVQHFIRAFQTWIDYVRVQTAQRRPVELSLNKTNYHGKRTRALLYAIGWTEPKTLGLLIAKTWEEIPEA